MKKLNLIKTLKMLGVMAISLSFGNAMAMEFNDLSFNDNDGVLYETSDVKLTGDLDNMISVISKYYKREIDLNTTLESVKSAYDKLKEQKLNSITISQVLSGFLKSALEAQLTEIQEQNSSEDAGALLKKALDFLEKKLTAKIFGSDNNDITNAVQKDLMPYLQQPFKSLLVPRNLVLKLGKIYQEMQQEVKTADEKRIKDTKDLQLVLANQNAQAQQALALLRLAQNNFTQTFETLRQQATNSVNAAIVGKKTTH